MTTAIQTPPVHEEAFVEVIIDGTPVAWPPVKQPVLAGAEDDSETHIVQQSSWEYLTEHIEEFAVAKAVADFFDANPKLLTDRNVPFDALGLHMLAKVELKRNAVRFAQSEAAKQKQLEAEAETAKALAKAREASRGFMPRLKRFGTSVTDLIGALRSNPHLLTMAVLSAWALSSHFSHLMR